mmetsp:Transcript_42248/g.132307  ORF Transcript_42248/g.132307 Transcript_42248/m.132307 type:complete len:1086 (-) Transcript_42248:257-3514(-)
MALRRASAAAAAVPRRMMLSTSTSAPVLGILREEYSCWERRSPLAPKHVARLTGAGVTVKVQPSGLRSFVDADYIAAGATLDEDLDGADLIVGVKPPNNNTLKANTSYMFFSHTIKAQPENMPLLDEALFKKVRMIDYECIRDGGRADAPRLVAFGYYAGLAGMIDTFQALGQKAMRRGLNTPFLSCPTTHQFASLEDARRCVRKVGAEIAAKGVPGDLHPLVVGFTGAGNSARGAQEIFELLPHEYVSPDQLKYLSQHPEEFKRARVYGVRLSDEHLFEKKESSGMGVVFNKAEYRSQPELYRSKFSRTAKYVTAVVNCIYWDERFPRLMTREEAKDLFAEARRNDEEPKFCVLSDITCDIGGPFEFLHDSTYPDKPYYNWDPDYVDVFGKTEVYEGVRGPGVAVQAVDILPSELPRESSVFFGDQLMPFLPRLLDNAAAYRQNDGAAVALDGVAAEVSGACITAAGELQPAYGYISKLRELNSAAGNNSADGAAAEQRFFLEGHLFDTGLINKVLDAAEAGDAAFELENVHILPNIDGDERPHLSSAVVKISGGNSKSLEQTFNEICKLVDAAEGADASIKVLGKDATGVVVGSASNNTLSMVVPGQKVLLLGSGRVALPLVEHLASQGVVLTCVSGVEQEADAVALRAAEAGTPAEVLVAGLDANDSSFSTIVGPLVAEADVVCSLLPAAFHPSVLRECIAHKTDMVTASYVCDRTLAQAGKAESAGIRFLGEMGLDPGMDHMSACRIIDDIKNRGGRVSKFESVCGGLPAPESVDPAANPLLYKFSWAPRGVLSAAQNAAVWEREGERFDVEGQELLENDADFENEHFAAELAKRGLQLECLPNRDSLKYKGLYDIEKADTVFRGTLRYRGWSNIFNGFQKLGLMDANAELKTGESMMDYIRALINEHGAGGDDRAMMRQLLVSAGVKEVDRVINAVDWLGLDEKVSSPTPVVEAFCDLLIGKLKFEDGETDIVYMSHAIEGVFDQGTKVGVPVRELHHSNFMLTGNDAERPKDTAMATTVGITAAVGVELLLGDRAKEAYKAGILYPMHASIYGPALDRLASVGLTFSEGVNVTREERAA